MSTNKQTVKKQIDESRNLTLQSPPPSPQKEDSKPSSVNTSPSSVSDKSSLDTPVFYSFKLPSAARYKPTVDIDGINIVDNTLMLSRKANFKKPDYGIPFGFTHNDLSSLYGFKYKPNF